MSEGEERLIIKREIVISSADTDNKFRPVITLTVREDMASAQVEITNMHRTFSHGTLREWKAAIDAALEEIER